MEYSSISDRLRQLRERSGLSIRALADRVGVPASTYSNYEARYKRPYLPMEFAQALAQSSPAGEGKATLYIETQVFSF